MDNLYLFKMENHFPPWVFQVFFSDCRRRNPARSRKIWHGKNCWRTARLGFYSSERHPQIYQFSWVGYLKWVCLKIGKTPKPNGFADHYPYEKWRFHWESTQHFQTNPNVLNHQFIWVIQFRQIDRCWYSIKFTMSWLVYDCFNMTMVFGWAETRSFLPFRMPRDQHLPGFAITSCVFFLWDVEHLKLCKHM